MCNKAWHLNKYIGFLILIFLLQYKPELKSKIRKIENENDITQEDDGCFGPSKFKIMEATFLQKICEVVF